MQDVSLLQVHQLLRNCFLLVYGYSIIIEYDINNTTKYIVICSDGVWEFISNEQVRDIGNIFYAKNDVFSFCSELIKYSTRVWSQIDIARDDITVVGVFF